MIPKRKRQNKTIEHLIQNAIADWLMYKGFLVWRNNTGVIRTNKGSYIHMGMTGMPDLFALRDGMLLGVEVKQPGKKPTDIQTVMLKALADHGAQTLIATSVEDIETYLERMGI